MILFVCRLKSQVDPKSVAPELTDLADLNISPGNVGMPAKP